ncbi:MAG: hypothetical protein WBV93_06710 [Anaerobacillus sp.]
MKIVQAIIAIPSAICLCVSLFISYHPGILISFCGIFVALLVRLIRVHNDTYMLGHPDRHADDYGYELSNDPLDQAETYEKDK